MKKKFLSVLLSLAMLLTLLPVSALAVDLTDEQKDALLEQGYTEEQIAELEADDKIMVVTEDTEIDEDYDGLILVVGTCTVTVKGASVGVGVVVLPGAVDAKVVLTEAAEVNAVVILEKAEVVVEAEAQVTYLTVAAPEAVATVEGAVEKLTIDEAAEGASVVITETAAVDEYNINAANTSTEIADGADVGEVNVGENATGTEITGPEDLNINDEGGNASLNGEPVKSEEPEDGDKDDEDDEDDEDKEPEEPILTDDPIIPEQPTPEEPTPEEPTPARTPITTDTKDTRLGIISAPLSDRTTGDDHIDDDDLYYEHYTNSTAKADNKTIDVTIHATNLQPHLNGASQNPLKAQWVGIGIPVRATDENTLAEGNAYCYCFVQIKTNDDGTKSYAGINNGSSYHSSKFTVDDTQYSALYFNATSYAPADAGAYDFQILVTTVGNMPHYTEASSYNVFTGEEEYNRVLAVAETVINLNFELEVYEEPEDESTAVALEGDIPVGDGETEGKETPAPETPAPEPPAETEE